MGNPDFLRFTASDEWLTAEALTDCLDQAGYWTRWHADLAPGERVSYLQQVLMILRDADGQRLFEHLEVLVQDRPTLVYKQARLLSRAGTREAD